MTKSRIMVVDDESIIRMDIKEMLLEAGYDVIAESNSGELAIELAAKLRPDLIVMDVKMPRMNGIKASRIIQQSWQIPVVLLTAYSQTEFIEEAKNAEIVGYLVKPITENDLIPAVEIALNQSKRLHSLMGNIKKLEQQIEDQKIIEKAKGIIMETYHLNEEAAYKKLRSYCMNHQVQMIAVAHDVIKNRCLNENMIKT
ncbi:ANTAR domain-containing response regulator [Paenibacillus andongensis]|uniref:ANTAR domain-containing response regulator n=1 Tax=Paenibacillus andongensis TaxID=2975482 RepID=UPI0021BB896C|nr:response regulator [Paenibacillus andongensis]